MAMERQTAFGWLVSVDVFLGGAGAGVFLISFIMGLLGRFESLAKIGAVIGPVLVLLGTSLLFADLGTKTNFYRLFRNPLSWMSRGTWFIAVFVILGLAYSLPAFWLPWDAATLPAVVIGVIAAIFAVLVMVYTGFLFGAAKRIPFWGTSALPLLFFFSSLYTGMAVLLLIAGFFELAPAEALRELAIAEIILILMQLLVLGASLVTARYGGTTAVESVRLLMRRPLFITMVIIVGLVIPLGLLGYYGVALNTVALSILAGILLLIGGLFLRYFILRAGVRLPL